MIGGLISRPACKRCGQTMMTVGFDGQGVDLACLPCGEEARMLRPAYLAARQAEHDAARRDAKRWVACQPKRGRPRKREVAS